MRWERANQYHPCAPLPLHLSVRCGQPTLYTDACHVSMHALPPYTHIQPQTFKHTHTHHTHASYINNHAKTNTHTIHKAPPSHSPIHTKQAPTHANLYIHRHFRDFICYEKHTHRFSAIIMNYIVNQILRN